MKIQMLQIKKSLLYDRKKVETIKRWVERSEMLVHMKSHSWQISDHLNLKKQFKKGGGK